MGKIIERVRARDEARALRLRHEESVRLSLAMVKAQYDAMKWGFCIAVAIVAVVVVVAVATA